MSIKLILLERMKQEPANYALLLLPCGKCVCLCVGLRLPVPACTSPRTRSDVISKVTWKGSAAPRLLQLDPPSQHQRAHSCFCLRAKGREVEIEFIHNKCDTASVRVRARQRLFRRTLGHPLHLVMLSRTFACLKLGRRCLFTVAVCHREIITHRAKYISKMIVVRFLMARCEVRSMGGKVNCGVVNVCSCSRYKLCVSHILAIRFVVFREAFIQVSHNCCGVWIKRQLLKRIYIPEIYPYTELSCKISYLLRPVFLINPEGNNN